MTWKEARQSGERLVANGPKLEEKYERIERQREEVALPYRRKNVLRCALASMVVERSMRAVGRRKLFICGKEIIHRTPRVRSDKSVSLEGEAGFSLHLENLSI